MAVTSLSSSINQQILQTDLHTFLRMKIIKVFSPGDHFNDSHNHSIYLLIYIVKRKLMSFPPGTKGGNSQFLFL